MRTFEEALKRLAERWPEKFWIISEDIKAVTPEDVVTHREWFRFGQDSPNAGKTFEILPDLHVTQDDIDSILALIGWEYSTHRVYDMGTRQISGWDCYPAKIQVGEFELADHRPIATRPEGDLPFPTKLLAAKAALIAIVAIEEKEKT
jgi:hypothetical protein